jgi:hypothetical protein
MTRATMPCEDVSCVPSSRPLQWNAHVDNGLDDSHDAVDNGHEAAGDGIDQGVEL